MILTHDGATATPGLLRRAEDDLLIQTGGVETLWVGRAATALYFAYLLAADNSKAQPGEIILPAMACATPANVARLAGFIPRFADCDPDTGLITLGTVKERWTPATRAVVFIHLYGQTAALDELARWCTENRIMLIEDIAQAQGARLPDGRLVGSVGDTAVYSFNRTKILECGGGALVVRDEAHARRLAELAGEHGIPTPFNQQSRALLSLSYRNLHHALVALKRLHPKRDISTPFLALRDAYDELELLPLGDPAAIAGAWNTVGDVLSARRAKAEIYGRALAGNRPWKTLDGWRQSGACWRYSLLFDFPDRLVEFSEAVRADGFHVSNLYWDLSSFFRPDDFCPESDRFARRIVNLWVDASVNAAWVRRCCESIIRHGHRIEAEEASSTREAYDG